MRYGILFEWAAVGVAESANWTLIKLFNMPCMQRAATFVLTHRIVGWVGGEGAWQVGPAI